MSKIKAIGYVRVSTEDQQHSPEVQKDAIKGYCKLKNFGIKDIIVDHGVSAGHPLSERPGGKKLLDFIEKGEAGAVVSYKLDRLFRDASDCLIVTKAWDSVGVSLHLIDLGGASVDTKSPMGRFFLTVMAAAAEMERNLIRERTRAIAAHKKRNKERVGMLPYGYQLAEDGIHIEPNTYEQKVIKWILQKRSEGWSMPAIIVWLEANKVKPRGKRWHVTTVRRILVNNDEPKDTRTSE
jgi:DNA invertase Pin-like site-specific DNA recombinase